MGRVESVGMLGQPIVVYFNITDGSDGRERTTTLRDWVGLFREGECDHNEPNNQLRHKCFLQWEYVPIHQKSGHIQFHYQAGDWGPGYQNAGDYEVRYFYGTDPGIAYFQPGPLKQGYVCHEWVDGDPIVNPTIDPELSGAFRHGNQGVATVRGLSLEDCECDPDTVTSKIKVTSATYGRNCQTKASHLPNLENNALAYVATQCDGKTACTVPVIDIGTVTHDKPALPATDRSQSYAHEPINLQTWHTCHKDVMVEYTCTGHSECPPIDNYLTPKLHTKCKQIHYHTTEDWRNPETEQIVRKDLGFNLTMSCPKAAARSACLSTKAACGRCALDTAVTASIRIVKMGPGGLSDSNQAPMDAWVDTMHHVHSQAPEALPGFEVAVPV